MSKLFNRYFSCKLGTREIQGLAAQFDTKADSKASPNKCDLIVYNLNETSRRMLESSKLPVEITAGYVGSSAVIFSGFVQNAFSAYDGANIATTINAGDGIKQIQESRVAFSVNPGESAASVIERAADALGVGLGNLATVAAAIAGQPSLFPFGGAVHGSAYDELTRVAARYGYQTSIQNGVLLLLEGKATRKTVEVFSASTGMTGAPKVDTKKKISFDCLLRPSIAIGDQIKVESAFISGFFRVIEYQHKGHTHELSPWTTSIVCDSKV